MTLALLNVLLMAVSMAAPVIWAQLPVSLSTISTSVILARTVGRNLALEQFVERMLGCVDTGLPLDSIPWPQTTFRNQSLPPRALSLAGPILALLAAA